MDIRFYNTHNLVIPILDLLLINLNSTGVKAEAYISYWNYRKKSERKDSAQYFKKASITRFFTFHKRINQIVYFVAACFKVLITKPRLNIFFTQPPLMVIFSAFISRMRGVKYTIHLMDLYPDMLSSLGYLNKNSLIYKILDKWMLKAMIHAEFVVILGDCMFDYLKAKGVAEDKMLKVINVPSISKPTLKNQQLLNDLGLSDKFTFLYAGNMGIAHEFETILQVSEMIESSHKDIQFIFLGRGHRRKEIEKHIETKSPTNVRLLNSLEDEAFSQVLSYSDIHFISLKNEFLGLMMPSKFYSSIASSKPILFEGPIQCEIAREIEKFTLGRHVAHKDTEALKASVINLYDRKDFNSDFENNSLKYFQRHCNPTKVIDNYSDYITTLLNKV